MPARAPASPGVDFGAMVDELERGRESYRQRAWRDADRALSAADSVQRLSAADLEALATSAYLIGLDDEALGGFERAHHAWLDGGESTRAARCAFWLGLQLLLRGDAGRARGWLARAQRLLDRDERDCVEHGYLQLPAAEQHLGAANPAAAYAAAARAARCGVALGDRRSRRRARPAAGPSPPARGRLLPARRGAPPARRGRGGRARVRSGEPGGYDPQPGLALLRLAQGQTSSAVAAMHRAVRTTADPLHRTRLLPALIWGRHDLATPLAVAEAASARYGWPLVVIDGAADDPAIEQPAAFVAAVRTALGGAAKMAE